MDRVVATFADSVSALRAIEALLSAGVKREEITVISSLPLDELHGGETGKAVLMPWLVTLGAILGGFAGYLLVTLTQKSYPIATGGMPIASLWTNGIITYELTMLGAILTTLLVLFWTAPLLRWKQRAGSGPVDADSIVVEAVPSTAELKEKIRVALQNCAHESDAPAPGSGIPRQSQP